MNHGSLFSGIGGFDLAAEWMGWENILHCEWNPFCQRILKYYWPNAASFGDITKTDFTHYANKIDILTGGFPCQPYSTAGKRLGKEDERHLWPQMLRAIREISPRWVVGENVRGLTNWNGGLVFDEVQADLEAEGYKVLPFLLPACAVNAPHRRDRIWFVAYSTCKRNTSSGKSEQTERGGRERIEGTGENRIRSERPFGLSGLEGDATNANSKRFEKFSRRKQRCIQSQTGSSERGEFSGTFETGTGWQNFPTQSPVCDGNDGFPAELDGITFSKWRNESIKAGGNTIVPQVALEIYKAIEEYEKYQK